MSTKPENLNTNDVDYLLKVLKHTLSAANKPNYHDLATETGIVTASQAQVKLKKTLVKAGLSLVNGSVIDPAASMNGTTTTPQQSKPARRKRKGAPVLSTRAKKTKQYVEKDSEEDESGEEEKVEDQASD